MDEGSNSHGVQDYKYSRVRLYFSACAASTLYISVGTIIFWPSPALPLLEPRNYTSFQNSMLSALPNLAPGPLLTIFGINSIGRKGTLLVIWLTMMSSWLILSITENINIMLTARFIGGWGMSAAFSAIGIFNSEISDATVRGSLNSMSSFFICTGQLIEYCIGPFVSYEALTLVSGATTFVFLLFYWFLPESPYFSITKGKLKQARLTLLWLRKNGPEEKIEEELSQILQTITEEKDNKGSIREALISKPVLKQFAVAWFILFFQQLTGLMIFAAYAQTIFQSSQLTFNGAYVPIFLAVYNIFSSLLAPPLIQKFGNKIVFLITGFACSVSHLILASYFFLLEGGHDVSLMTFLPILGAFMLMTSVNVGFAGLVWAVISDLFSPSVKGFATGVSGIFSTFLGFAFTAAFGIAKDTYGLGIVFLSLSLLLFVGSFGFFFIPDVTKMTLQQIQDSFGNKPNDFIKQEIPLLNVPK